MTIGIVSKFKVGDRVQGITSRNEGAIKGPHGSPGWWFVQFDDGLVRSTHEDYLDLVAPLATEAEPSMPDPDQAILDAFEANDSQAAIAAECDAIKAMLLEKNAAYGNSALEPVRVFSRADPVEQIRVRIDDKLSRLARGANAGEDVELDLIGYLVLLRIAKRKAGNA